MSIQELFATPVINQFDKIAACSFYVDNCICSFDNIEEAHLFFENIMQKMDSVKFNLRDWISNDRNLYLKFSLNKRAEFKVTSILGLSWSPSYDSFLLKINLKDYFNWNKANILSTIASVYDPLGWLTPCLLDAKIFMQQTWSLDKKKFDWSTFLPSDLQTEWCKIFNVLKQFCLTTYAFFT